MAVVDKSGLKTGGLPLVPCLASGVPLNLQQRADEVIEIEMLFAAVQILMATPAGFEPATLSLEG